uniref:Uncharacterized protein n=1 Tax=Rhizophora mucronata TaxID=61149 RepID=A0A2P2P3U9_RHIMU
MYQPLAVLTLCGFSSLVPKIMLVWIRHSPMGVQLLPAKPHLNSDSTFPLLRELELMFNTSSKQELRLGFLGIQ